jgi:hypothetical protein
LFLQSIYFFLEVNDE